MQPDVLAFPSDTNERIFTNILEDLGVTFELVAPTGVRAYDLPDEAIQLAQQLGAHHEGIPL